VIELGDMLPRRGIATDEISARLAEIAKREKRIPIIILDEVDRLLDNSAQDDRILYDLSRSQEAIGLASSLIAITNEKEIALKLDARVRSVLANHTIYFEQYTPTQLKEILKQRAKIALFDDAYDDDVIGLCAGIGAKSQGDARLALHLLWASAKKAQSQSCKKITVEHVQAVRERAVQTENTLAQRKEDVLEDIDKKIIQIVRDNKTPIESGQIYDKLQIPQEKIRGIRNHLEKLNTIGILECEEVRKGQGRTRIWRIAVKKPEHETKK
jgi:cell division control protein 6